jgi:hypothetical protein
MQLTIFESILDGFNDGEFDLASLFAREPAKQDDFVAQIIDNIVDVFNTPDAGASLSLAGHSDRYDASSNHIQCLGVESAASTNRVNSALALTVLLVQQREPTAPADLNNIPNFAVRLRAPGAGVLVNSGYPLSEAQRKENRRVQARLMVFKC